MAFALLLAPPFERAEAALGSVTPSVTLAAANGTATITYTTAGGAASDIVQFTTSRGTWTNGSTIITVTSVSSVATAKLSSSVAGGVTVIATNLTAGGTVTDASASFYAAPSATNTGALTLATDGALSATTSTALTTASQAVTLVTGFEDSTGGGIPLVGFPVTLKTTLGTFAQSGSDTLVGLSGGGGALPTATLSVSLASAASGEITAVITTTMGDLTVTGKIKVVGPAATLSVSRTTPATGNILGTDAQVFTVKITDSVGNGVSGKTPVASVATASAGMGTITGACGATGSLGTTTCTYTGASATKLGDATINFTLVQTPPLATLTGSATITQVASAKAIVITGDDTVEPGAAAVYTATITDTNGNAVKTGGATVTFATTGGAGGNLVVQKTPNTTDAAGQATATFVSGGTEGTFTITAVDATSGLVTFKTITVEAAAPVTPPPPAEVAGVATAPAAGGITQVVAGTTDIQALIDAQTFNVLTVFVLDVSTQQFLRFVVGGPAVANTLTALNATDIVTLRSQ